MPTVVARSEKDRDRVLARIGAFPVPSHGLEITWRAPKRSSRQNRYLWGVVYRVFAEELSKLKGELIVPEDIHEICRRSFMPRRKVPGFVDPVPISTTKLTRSGEEQSFQDYVMAIQELAANFQIYIPDPDEETV